MEVLLPMLAAAAPAAVSALAVGTARGAGGVIGKAAGDAIVGTVGNVGNAIGGTISGVGNTISGAGNTISGFFNPPSQNPGQGNGQQRVILMTNNGPVY